jgi:hypothetical protein
MKRPQAVGLVLVLSLAIAGCGGGDAPQGRWEGFSQSANWLVAVRLQVDKGNVIRATALSVGVDGVSLPRRMELTRQIKSALPQQWPMAPVGQIDFKDNIITKAGGFAPLFVYDPRSQTMTFQFYAGGRLTERVKLHPVRQFAGA